MQKTRSLSSNQTKFYNTLNTWNQHNIDEPFGLEKSIAIRFFIHIFSDIHQPLHAATLVSKDFPNGDRGGNSINVKFMGQKFNLHSIYDQIFRKLSFSEKPFKPSFIEYLEKEGAKLIEEFPEVEDLSFEEITLESNKLAETKVYPGVSQGSNLSEDYADEAFEMCKLQLARSGHRLKKLMIDVYDKYQQEKAALQELKSFN